MTLNTLPGVLTILPENSPDIVTLQYQPSSLSINSSTSTNNVRGIKDLVTFISSENNYDSTITIGAYFTAIEPINSGINAIGAGIGAVAVAAALGSTEVINILNTASGVINTSFGCIDLLAGVVRKSFLPASPVSLSSDQFNKLYILNNMMRRSIRCRINWDIENSLFDEQYYIINGLNIMAERIQSASNLTPGSLLTPANTLEVNVAISMIKCGVRVMVQ